MPVMADSSKPMLMLPPPPDPGTVIHIPNPFRQDRRIIYHVEGSPTIREWLDYQGIEDFPVPTICLMDDEPVLRSQWTSRRIQGGQLCVFATVPGFFGAAIVAFFGVTGTLATVLAAVINVVIAIGVSQLVNLLIGKPKGLSNRVARDQAQASPTYDIQAQGNLARLGSSIPVIYGQMRIYPDYASAPYTEFAGNEQYLYQLFCIGQGTYTVADSRIEDSPFSSFEECSILGIYGPGQTVTAFPSAAYTSVEVSDQELLQNEWVGHFIINPTGTLISRLMVDIVAPGGMYFSNDEGELEPRSATFSIQAGAVDDDGNLLGGFTTLGDEIISGATVTPIRKSYSYTLPSSGRWAARIIRTNGKDTSFRAGNAIHWAGLRGFSSGTRSYPGVTTVATKFKASNNLSDASSRRVNFLVSRHLQSWNPATRTWGSAAPTRSIAWAFADICRAAYGAGLGDSRIDVDGIYALETALASRNLVYGATGDWCDIAFDNTVTVWEALKTVARLGRAMPVVQGGVIRVVRDQQQSVYTAVYTPRNMLKNSFSVEYLMPSDETADAVIVQYWDSDAMRTREVTAILQGSTSNKPAKVQLEGCTSKEHAWREGRYIAAANRYRRKVVKFQTELEGHIPITGDLIVVSHDMPVWGQAGDVDGYDAQYEVFTLSEPINFEPPLSHYLVLRKLNGGVSGPWLVIPAVPPNPNRCMLSPGQTLDISLNIAGDKERTHFVFGKADNADNFRLFRVMAPIRYRDNGIVEITAVNEDYRVHEADDGDPPDPIDPDTLPTRPTRPILTGFSISQSGTPDSPILNLDWLAVGGATHYLVEISTDNDHWTRVFDSLTTSVSFPVEPGVLWVRVAAAGLALGPFIVQQIMAGVVPPPGVVQGLAATETFTGTQARIGWAATKRATSYRIEVWAEGSKIRDAVTILLSFSYSSEDVLKDGGPWRELTFRVWAVSSVGESDDYAELTLSNPPPGALTGVAVYAGTRSAIITYSRPSDLDFAGVLVCMSQSQGFTPLPDVNEVYRGGDRTITIPGLAEGETYYFRLGAFDAFGIEGIDFGTSEYHASISSANLPSPGEVKDALQAALNDPDADPLIFDADLFGLRVAGSDRTPFIVGVVDGQDVIQMDASVYILGTLSASQIRTGDLAADQQITLGNGVVVLDGSGNLIVYDPQSPDPDHPDYSLFTAGRLTFQAYRDGQYIEQKSVKRIETGIADSGTTVILPGYWDSQPYLMVGIKSLRAYEASYMAQSQAWQVEARNLAETAPGSKRWQFDAIAELQLAASAGSVTAGSSYSWGSSNAFTSLEYNLVNNTQSITVRASFGSYRGTGTGTYIWAYRSIRWKIQLWNNGISQWEDANQFRIVDPAGQGATQIKYSDYATVAVPAGRTKVRVYAESYDRGGTYSTGADTWEYSYGAYGTPDSNTYTAQAGGNPNGFPGWTGSQTKYSSIGAPSGVSGWTTYGYEYYYEWRSYASGGSYHTGTVTGPGLSYSTPGGTAAYDTGWSGRTFSSTGFSSSACYITATAANIGSINYVIGQIRNAKSRTKVKRLIVNSSTPFNYFEFVSFDWTTPSATVLGLGSLSWLAVGE